MPIDLKITTGPRFTAEQNHFAGQAHRLLERDESLIARMVDLERLFWDYVVSDTPPPADGSASAEQALRCLYPQDSGQSVDFSGLLRDRKSTRLNSSHYQQSRMPSSA